MLIVTDHVKKNALLTEMYFIILLYYKRLFYMLQSLEYDLNIFKSFM